MGGAREQRLRSGTSEEVYEENGTCVVSDEEEFCRSAGGQDGGRGNQGML